MFPDLPDSQPEAVMEHGVQLPALVELAHGGDGVVKQLRCAHRGERVSATLLVVQVFAVSSPWQKLATRLAR